MSSHMSSSLGVCSRKRALGSAMRLPLSPAPHRKALRAAAPALWVLVTSQVRLHLDDEGPVADLHPIQGELPSPLAPPPGCHFHQRCPLANDRCRQQAPGLLALDEQRSVACHQSEFT